MIVDVFLTILSYCVQNVNDGYYVTAEDRLYRMLLLTTDVIVNDGCYC